MVGGATFKFMTLLTTPFPPSFRLLHRRFSSFSVTTFRPISHFSLPNTKSQTPKLTISFHSQPNNNNSYPTPTYHPWPEYTNFLNMLSNGQGLKSAPTGTQSIPPEDAFVLYEQVSDEFFKASGVCLAFARSRPDLIGLLSRRDIEALVSNGTPFLFKSAIDTARRMRAFLGTDGTNVSEFDKANTNDLMKYILSYASNPTVSSERNGLYSRELVDSSVRNLLNEMCTLSFGTPSIYMDNTQLLSGGQRQNPRPFGQNVEMKRGDWICPKCTFMNFARNMKCLECEESRPKKQLTGGEWECPQCDFFNYARNSACLRCDCRRPGAPLSNTINASSSSSYNRDYSLRPNMDNSFVENKNPQLNKATDTNSTASIAPETKPINQINNQDLEKVQDEKSQKWFTKIAALHDVKDLPSAISDEDFPEIMPMRKGENRFVVSKKKDRSLTSPKYKRQEAMDQANNTNFVPFVPFPPGYFDKKDPDQSNSQDSPVKSSNDSKITPENEKLDDPNSTFSQNSTNEVRSFKRIDKNENVGSNWSGKSLEGSAVTETNPLDMSEEAKAERWFKRVAQIKDISELSQIPDEDFPSIMPMRKGVNRFVVSKRKTPLERRLTSQQYRRNLPVVSNEPVKKEGDNS